MKRKAFTYFFAFLFGISCAIAAPEKSSRRPSSESGLSFLETGNRSGSPIVLIHAFPLNKAMWDDQVKALKKSFRVITLDIRGLGGSRSDAPYTLEFVVDDLIRLLDQLNIDRAIVCGVSMGGFVALRAVERNPERFRGLVLADTKSEPDSDSSKLGRYRALKSIQDEGLPAYVDSFLKSAFAPSDHIESSPVFNHAKVIANSNMAAGVSAAVLALTSRTDTTPDLGKIHIPTLILQGEFDSVIPLAAAQSLQQKIIGSKIFVIPKAGHLSNLENPEVFNKHLVQFISELKP